MCSGQRINAITIPEEMLKGREFEDYVIAYSGRYPFTNSGDIRSVRW